jgi:hypothetical protein
MNETDDFAAAQAQFLAPKGKPASNVVPLQQKEPLLRDALSWLSESTPADWIVQGLLQQGMVYAITAQTNHGKTAVTLDMALAVASGGKFANRSVKQGRVLILCGENPEGFRTRMLATIKARNIERATLAGQIHVLPISMPLAEIRGRLREEATKVGEFALVLIDTSVSFFSGDSEDDNVQARDHALDIRSLTLLPGKPAIAVNCHPSKGATQDTLVPRGGGAFLNEIDTNLTVWSDGDVATLHWHHKKRGPDFDPMYFRFQGGSITDAGGIKVPTVVAMHISDDQEDALFKERREHENRVLVAMADAPGASYADLAAECSWGRDNGKSRVKRIMDRLKDDGLVVKHRGRMRLTQKGDDEAKRSRR